MYIFLLIIHVIVCIVLILVVLLQAGRGGGFSDMLGGGQPQSLFGTQTNAFMIKATEVCAIVFIITSLSLAILSTQRGKSLVANQRLLREIQSKIPTIPQPPQAPPRSQNNAPSPQKTVSPVTAAPVTAASAGAVRSAETPAGGGSASGGNATK